MSTVTNTHGISKPVLDAMARFEQAYNKGGADYSATDLIKPAWMGYLQRKHHADIVRDAGDTVASFIGNCVHDALARAGSEPGAMVEERFSAEFAGKLVSGAVDYAKPPIVRDYKVWKAIKVKKILAGEPGAIDELEQQLNVYACLIRKATGTECYDLAGEIIIGDWSKGEAERDPSYPQCAWQLIPVECWPDDEQERWIEAAVNLREAVTGVAEQPDLQGPDGPPVCRPEQRWEKPAVFAVMKRGNKRASKLCATREEADAWIGKQKPGAWYVEHRPADPVRCRSWCNVNFACPFWQAHPANKEG